MIALRYYGEKKALHHCGNYCTVSNLKTPIGGHHPLVGGRQTIKFSF